MILKVFQMPESNTNTEVLNIVIHGRGGQGGVTASQIIVEAAFLSGHFEDVHASPSFGAERRGAPIQAFARLSRKNIIWDRAEIQNPDILIILDETVLTQSIASSLKKNGILVANSGKEPKYFADSFKFDKSIKIIVSDINNMALEKNFLTVDGNPIVNTPILGLLSKALPELSVENLKKVVLKMMGEKLGKLNCDLIQESYNSAKML